MSQRKRRTYDHRIKAQIIAAGDPSLFPEPQIPRSTAKSWIRRGAVDIVAIDDASYVEQQLRTRLAKLDHRVSMLVAVLRLVLALLRTSGFKSVQTRIAEADTKRRLLSAIERARKVMPLAAALRVLELSAAR